MSESFITPGTAATPGIRLLRFAVPTAIVMALIAGLTVYSFWAAQAPAPTLAAAPADAGSVLSSLLKDPSQAAFALMCTVPTAADAAAAAPAGAWTFVKKPASHPAAAKAISAQTLEKRYGIRIVLIAVTSLGSMVDFRFKILDLDKALPLLGDGGHDSMPMLMVAGTNVMLEGPRMMHMMRGMNYKTGSIYFLNYSNRSGAVKYGTPLAVTIGGVRVEPILAQ